MSTRRIPIASRWSLLALGSAQVGKAPFRAVNDPVAAWLLKRAPQLRPQESVPTVMTMIRCRTRVLDRMIREELEEARQDGLRVELWSIGGGFDGRWSRLESTTRDVVDRVVELDIPDVARTKAELISESRFAAQYSSVEVQARPSEEWSVDATQRRVIVVLDGVSTRLRPEQLQALLCRVRRDAPDARVVIDLPSFLKVIHPTDRVEVQDEDPYQWPRRVFHELGWEVTEDQWLKNRPTLQSARGRGLTPGMEAVRVVRLRGRSVEG